MNPQKPRRLIVLLYIEMAHFHFKIPTFVIGIFCLSANPCLHADESCATTKVVAGDLCKELEIQFDLKKCGYSEKSKTIKAKCWNKKSVARLKMDDRIFVATYHAAQEQWGRTTWSLASLVEERRESTPQNVTAKRSRPSASNVSPSPVPSPVEKREPAAETPIPEKIEITAPTHEGLKITGSLDFNYIYNFNKPQAITAPASNAATTSAQPAGNNGYRVFDIYHDDINLALAEMAFQHSKGDATGFIALDFGHTADILSPNDETTKHVTQATLNYKPKAIHGLSLTIGKMYTHLGAEVAKTKDNWQYSRSFLFGYAIPFWHTGIAISYPLISEKLTSALFLYNKNSGVYQTNDSKSQGAQISATILRGMTLTYNFLNGSEVDTATSTNRTRTLHEIVATYALSSKWAAQFDVVQGRLTRAKSDRSDAQWFAWSVATKWTPGKLSVSPRYEVYEDQDGLIKTGDPQTLKSSTLTFAYQFEDGIETRLEGRHDQSTGKNFSNSSGLGKDEQFTTTLGLLYNF